MEGGTNRVGVIAAVDVELREPTEVLHVLWIDARWKQGVGVVVAHTV